MARAKKEKDLTLEQQVEAARIAQANDKKPAVEPKFFEVRALCISSCSDGMRRKVYFHYHPNATYATGIDVANWLDKLYAKHADRLG